MDLTALFFLLCFSIPDVLALKTMKTLNSLLVKMEKLEVKCNVDE